jgi:hypothetical protein
MLRNQQKAQEKKDGIDTQKNSLRQSALMLFNSVFLKEVYDESSLKSITHSISIADPRK